MESRSVLTEGNSEGCWVRRHPQDLRVHSAVEDIGPDEIRELNEVAELQSATDSGRVHITADGRILAGFGAWRLAILAQKSEIDCLEYSFNEEQSLRFILSHHQPRKGWNAFNRVRVALRLEPLLQTKALDNQRAGGKYKGSANLPEAQHVDVREQVARVAGVTPRYVTVVKTILQSAHSRLIEALADGSVTIYRAGCLCTLSKADQLKQLSAKMTAAAMDKVIRGSIAELLKANGHVGTAALLDKLSQVEKEKPGSLVIRLSTGRRTTVLLGQDIMNLESVSEESQLP